MLQKIRFLTTIIGIKKADIRQIRIVSFVSASTCPNYCFANLDSLYKTTDNQLIAIDFDVACGRTVNNNAVLFLFWKDYVAYKYYVADDMWCYYTIVYTTMGLQKRQRCFSFHTCK